MPRSEVSESRREVRVVRVTFRTTVRALYTDSSGPILDMDLPDAPLLRDTVTFLSGLIESSDGDDHRDLLAILGRHLFEFVFVPRTLGDGSSPAPLARFEQALEWAQQRPERVLHVRLDFEPDAAELAAWPWELLYYPGRSGGWEGYFLNSSEHVVVLREMKAQRDVQSCPQPVKLLLCISEPDSNRGDVRAEKMRAILRAHERSDPPRITLAPAENLGWVELKATIERVRPEIFHFHGHGDGAGGVYLKRAPRRRVLPRAFTDVVPDDGVGTAGQTFAKLFAKFQPRLVLLTACETALSDVPFHDVAQQLANVGIPAVVAMQFRVTVEAAEEFAEKFYESLLNGNYIEEAFTAGLRQLTGRNAETTGVLESNRSFGTPVLFLNSTGALVERPREAAETLRGGTVVPIDSSTSSAPACVWCGAVGVVQAFCGQCGRPAACEKQHRYTQKVRFCPECGEQTGWQDDTREQGPSTGDDGEEAPVVADLTWGRPAVTRRGRSA